MRSHSPKTQNTNFIHVYGDVSSENYHVSCHVSSENSRGKLPFCFSSIQFRAVRYTIHFLNSGNLIYTFSFSRQPVSPVVTSLHYDRRTIREVTWSTGCIVTHLTVFSLPGQAKWWPHLNGPPWIITPSLRSPQKERWMDSRSTVEIQWYWAQIS